VCKGVDAGQTRLVTAIEATGVQFQFTMLDVPAAQ
jgi:hypothetical protein